MFVGIARVVVLVKAFLQRRYRGLCRRRGGVQGRGIVLPRRAVTVVVGGVGMGTGTGRLVLFRWNNPGMIHGSICLDQCLRLLLVVEDILVVLHDDGGGIGTLTIGDGGLCLLLECCEFGPMSLTEMIPNLKGSQGFIGMVLFQGCSMDPGCRRLSDKGRRPSPFIRGWGSVRMISGIP